MSLPIGVRILGRQLEFATALLAEAGPLSTASGSSYLDPHLVVLATLLAFWAVYVGLRIRDVLATAVGTEAERSPSELSEKP